MTQIGQLPPSGGTSRFNAMQFLITQMLSKTRTVQVVKVLSVTNSGDVSPVGEVSVQVLVNQMDGLGNITPHGEVFGIPYFRLQGGKNAVIIDPEVGDIGIICVADRDVSAVKANKGQANPGSYRRFSLSDGFYIGGFLNDTPEQYIQFNADGMKWNDKNGNVIQSDSDGVKINGVLFDRSQNISNVGTYDGSGEGTFNGHTVGAHIHSDPQGGDTGPPTG